MGYTHYFHFTPSNGDEQKVRKSFAKAARELMQIYKNLSPYSESAGGYYNDVPLIIRGGQGEGEPIINESEIWFNGDGEYAHETFGIYAGQETDDFCKTARKPYDLLVCCAILALANNLPQKVFSFGSDGKLEDWQPAIDLYTTITKRKPKKHSF